MAKIQLHYKYIAGVFLILLCFAVFTYIIIHDVSSNKSTTPKTGAPQKPDVVVSKIRTFSKDVLRKPQLPADTPNKVPIPTTDEIVREDIEATPQHPQNSSDPRPSSILANEDQLLDTLERFVKSKQQKVVTVSHHDYYVAAVIDFAPLFLGDVISKARWNTDQYVSIIRECERYMVDIVVFPETGIFLSSDNKEEILNVAPTIPPAEAYAVPCDEFKYNEVLTKLSCAAKYSGIYVVVTLMEKFCMENTACTRRDLYLYLTTVVFDRSGKIIARYRKYNLHIDRFFPGVDEAREPELVIFGTDFNVTFGILSSFDLFFKHPAATLIEKHDITDIVVPSSLPTRLPFLAASSVPAGWSYVMDVNLLCARSADVLGVAGNNVFFGRRLSTQTYSIEYSSSTIVIAPVPKFGKEFPHDFADQYLTLQPYANTKKHYSYQVEHVLASIKMEPLFNRDLDPVRTFYLATPDFFCNITVQWEPSMVTTGFPGYRMAAFAGLNNYTLSSINNYVEMCGLMQCSSVSDSTCYMPPSFDDSAKVTITSLHVKAASRLGVNDIRIPVTLKSDLTTCDTEYYEFENYIKSIDEQEYNIAEINLKKPVSKLVAFGVYKLPEKINPAASYEFMDAISNADMVVG